MSFRADTTGGLRFQGTANTETMAPPLEAQGDLRRPHGGDNLSRQAWRWLHRLREVTPAEFAEFTCCFERLDGPAPAGAVDTACRSRWPSEAWIAVGRLAEITCDVRDGAVVAQLTVGSRLVSKQLLALDDTELPYVKVFSALASLLRTERALLPAFLPSVAAAAPRSLRWFGGWKYLPGSTQVSKAACFTLPRFAIRLDANGLHAFNWGAVPRAVTQRVFDNLNPRDRRGAARRQTVLDDRLHPSYADYCAAAQTVLAALSRKDCEKVVLSRKRILSFSQPLDPIDLFARLIEQKGHAFQYLMTLEEGETWVGISPELLLRRSGAWIETRPLAGSRRRGRSTADDANERHSLLTSDKDGREHDIAASHMFNRLQSVCERDTLTIVGDRQVAQLTYIQHLATEMTGRLDPACDAVDALACIYPPATILGKPEAPAEQIVRSCEPFQRSFFTGGVGMMSSSGDCEIALCIRSAAVSGHELHLYAGSGYVEGSVPSDEWRETETKMQPFVDVVASLRRDAHQQVA
ncbi:MAG: chorismate-binding protein [Acidobacteriota bacterium]